MREGLTPAPLYEGPVKWGDLYYVDITIPADKPEIAYSVFSIVHGFNRTHGAGLGIDLPLFEGNGAQRALEVIRIFGKAQTLAHLLSQKPITRIVLLTGSSSAVRQVPEATRSAVRVFRDLCAEHLKPSTLSRLRRRAEQRGQEFSAQDVITTIAKRLKNSETVSLPMASKTTARTFLLKLNRQRTEVSSEKSVEFNSYGLCKAGVLPAF